MKIYPFRAWLPLPQVIASPMSFAQDVKHHFRNYMESGYFKQRDHAELFVYQVEYESHRFLGFVATFDIHLATEGHIIPHENTLPHNEQSSMQLLLDREAIIKPILLTHQPHHEVRKILSATIQSGDPLLTHQYENTREKHSLWPISDPIKIEQIKKCIEAGIDKAYIADGHHRISVLKKLARDKGSKTNISYDRIIAGFFDFENLLVLDYNRMVHVGDFMSPLELIARLSQVAHITPVEGSFKPQKKHELSLYLEKQWFQIRWHDEVLARYDKEVLLDASILESELFNKILHVENVISDSRITYFTGNKNISEITSHIDQSRGMAAFFLYPVEINEIKKQADKGLTLPAKSTFFKPRLPNGFITQVLSDPVI